MAPTVALLLQSDGPGGAEFMLLHHAEQLVHLGHRVIHVGPAKGCGWLADRMRKLGIETRMVDVQRRMGLRCVMQLGQLFRREDVAVVHSHEFEMAVYGAVAARLADAQHVITMHGSRYYADRWRRRAALRWACGRSRAVVGVSERTAELLETDLGLPPGTVTVVPNGVPLPRGRGSRIRQQLNLEVDDILILAVGNLYPVKGHMVLLDAGAHLAAADSTQRWRIAIAGRGEEEQRLRRFIADHRLQGVVHLLGYRDDVGDLLDAADIWVMPSLSEGLPLALLEALRAGKAIVASRVGGIPEVIRHGTNGILVEAGDPKALLEALRDLMSNPDRRKTLGRHAHSGSQTFAVERMSAVYRHLYGVA